eukprot:9028524-Ditylum_brightwellii.AAC.1
MRRNEHTKKIECKIRDFAISSEFDFQSTFSVTSGKEVGVCLLNNQPKKPGKGAVLEAAVGGIGETKDGD